MNSPLPDQTPKRAQLPVNRSVLRWVLIVGASMSFLLAIGQALHTWHFRQTALRAPGKVIRLHQAEDEGDVTYRAVFQFKDETGKDHTVTSSVNMKPASHRAGDAVTVLYQRGNPEAARIDSYWELWLAPTIPGAIGAGLLVLSFLAARRKAAQPGAAERSS